jgi:hypothetical protein
MTWSKYGAEYSDELANAGVSDAAFRTHTEAIGWLYRVEDLKLRIPKHLVRRFAGSDEYDHAAKELTDLGLWRDRGDAWELVHHADVVRQSIQAQRQKRDRDKRAQQAKRDRAAAASKARSASVSADVPADVSHRISGDTDRQTVKRTSHTRATQTGTSARTTRTRKGSR